jgi:GPH family glycoside/pentoside/hexuronide:cation symporter
LQRAGFESGSVENVEGALFVLTTLYAAVPCVLKALALVLLATTEIKES